MATFHGVERWVLCSLLVEKGSTVLPTVNLENYNHDQPDNTDPVVNVATMGVTNSCMIGFK